MWAHLPQPLNSAGNMEAGDRLQISWTIGDLVVGHIPTSDLSLVAGFQATQVIEELVTGIELPSYVADIKAFPNALNDLIQLEIFAERNLNLAAELLDQLGRQLRFEAFQLREGNHYQMDVKTLPPGNYYLAVHQLGLGKIKVFKLLKQ